MVSHRSGVSNDTWGSLWRGSPSWPRLLAAPQPTGAGDHSPSHLRPSPRRPELPTGRELPQAGHPPTHPTLPWAIPLDPSEAHVGRYPLNTLKGGSEGLVGVREGEERGGGGTADSHGPRVQAQALGLSNRQLQRVLSCWAQFSTTPSTAPGFQVAARWLRWPPCGLLSHSAVSSPHGKICPRPADVTPRRRQSWGAQEGRKG